MFVRTLRLAACAAIAGLALYGLAGNGEAAAADKELNIYNWSDYIGSSTVADFEKETGIKVRYDTFDSYEALDAKMLTGKSGYDIIFPGNELIQHHLKAGLYKPLDKATLTNWNNLDPTILKTLAQVDPKNDYVVPYMWWTSGFAYDANKVKKRLPGVELDSLAVLLKPENAAKLQDCGIQWLDSPNDMMRHALTYLGKPGSSGDPADLKAAADLLVQLRPYVQRIETGSMINNLAAGDICISFAWSGDIVMAQNRIKETKSDVDLVYVVAKEGGNIGFDGMAIPKDAPHPDAAMQFLNYMLRPDVIAKVTNEIGYANANLAANQLVNPEILANPALYPSGEIMKRLYPTIPRDQEAIRVLTREWTRVKTGQ